MATFTIKRGDSWEKDFVRRALNVDGSTGAVIPYPVGSTARMQVRDPDSGSVMMSLSTATSGLTLDAAGGLISVAVLKEQTETLEEKAYPFDIEVTQPDGKRKSTETQYLKIKVDVTYD
jgi:hypothetical protein